MVNNIVTRKANGSVSIARTLLEMSEQGYVPIAYHLPQIVFGLEEEYDRKELYPEMQALVEEAMVMLMENQNKTFNVSIKGLIQIACDKKYENPEKGKDVKIILNNLNEIETICLNRDADVYNISFKELQKLFELVKNHRNLFVNNWGLKDLRLNIASRVRKLKKGLL